MLDELLSTIGGKDVLSFGEPIVQLVSNHCCIILNCNGLLELEDSFVVVKGTKNYNIRVNGENLICKTLNKNELTIVGRILNVCLESLYE